MAAAGSGGSLAPTAAALERLDLEAGLAAAASQGAHPTMESKFNSMNPHISNHSHLAVCETGF